MTDTKTGVWDFPFEEEGLEVNDAYRVARDLTGLARVQLPYGEPAWLVTRYEDVRFVLGDSRFSRAKATTERCPRTTEGVQRGGLLFMDRPQHSRLRTLIAKAFTIRRVEELRPKVHRVVAEMMAKMKATDVPADLVEDYAKPIRTTVICDLLGVPSEDRGRFRTFCEGVLSTAAQTREEFMANHIALREYMSELVLRRTREPADDLMTALIEARELDDRLTEPELVDVCIDILLPGYQSQVPNFVYALLEQPGAWDRLVAEPELLRRAIEELVRFVPLVEGAPFPRYATADVEVGGVLVRAGEPVVVGMDAANRDPLAFDRPDEILFDREGSHHFGFGHGIHFCPGSQLARMALREEMGALLREMPCLHLAGEAVWNIEMGIRGLRRMPIAW
ncbi:cytochrome P450 [Amycolatopsis sp. NPDC049868]|uniref:cytochrome P450 n=1 Tax=Amycolatopsis sp. NPDC049868 TaxID=3363934 RepID=UPI0037893595